MANLLVSEEKTSLRVLRSILAGGVGYLPVNVSAECINCGMTQMSQSPDGVTCGWSVCRDALPEIVSAMREELDQLENYTHPEVEKIRGSVLDLRKALRKACEVLDALIPSKSTLQEIEVLRSCKEEFEELIESTEELWGDS